jgi:hypothetical protein
MNRAARRKHAHGFSRREKAAWAENMERFAQASGGVAQGAIILASERGDWFAAAAGGDPAADMALRAIHGWFGCADKMPLPAKCLGCEVEFEDGLFPEGFAVLLPYANPTQAIATGVCPECALRERDDLLATAMQQWREVWPGLYSIRGGRA